MNPALPAYPSARGLLVLANVALPSPVHDNLDTVAQLRERSAHGASVHQRMFETVATRLGRPRTADPLGLQRDLPEVPDRDDPVARAMQEEVDPHAVHSAVKR